MSSYLAIVEVDQRQSYILRADKLREMLGASRLIEETVEIAKNSIGPGVKLIWPVSGVIWLTSSDIPALTESLDKIRRGLHRAGLSATFGVDEYSPEKFTDCV